MGSLDRQPVRVMLAVHWKTSPVPLQADVSPVRFGRFASPPRRQDHQLELEGEVEHYWCVRHLPRRHTVSFAEEANCWRCWDCLWLFGTQKEEISCLPLFWFNKWQETQEADSAALSFGRTHSWLSAFASCCKAHQVVDGEEADDDWYLSSTIGA